jgi:hypothetical protein
VDGRRPERAELEERVGLVVDVAADGQQQLISRRPVDGQLDLSCVEVSPLIDGYLAFMVI